MFCIGVAPSEMPLPDVQLGDFAILAYIYSWLHMV